MIDLDERIVCTRAYPHAPCEMTVRACIKRFMIARFFSKSDVGRLFNINLVPCLDCPEGAKRYQCLSEACRKTLINPKGLHFKSAYRPQMNAGEHR
jgi:hypothetical protein